MDKLGKSLNALYVDYKEIQNTFINMNFISMSKKSIEEFIERLKKFVDMFMEQWNQKYQEKRIQTFLKVLIKTFNTIKYLFCDDNHAFKNSSTITIDADFLGRYRDAKRAVMIYEATVDFYYKELALDVYGYSKVSGEPLTKTDFVLSKIFITFFFVFFAACIVVAIVAVAKDLIAHLATTLYVLGAITALFLILAIIDLLIRKHK